MVVLVRRAWKGLVLMYEIAFDDVRPGDVARSNGKELKVREVRPTVVALHAGEGTGVRWFTPGVAEFLGVSFWREERPLPDYPGAWVRANCVGNAVRNARIKGDVQPWLTIDPDRPWKSDEELLEWLGPDWGEETKPPARWVPVEPAEIAVGDYVRAEIDGLVLEGRVSVLGGGGRTPESIKLADSISLAPEVYTWFKREGGETDE